MVRRVKEEATVSKTSSTQMSLAMPLAVEEAATCRTRVIPATAAGDNKGATSSMCFSSKQTSQSSLIRLSSSFHSQEVPRELR